jgi:response regulator RpfG family c-di-GMP phosphodiesterase
MTAKILCVDDEPRILEAYTRYFRKEFTIDIAAGGQQGLLTLQQQGPYAVIVSDMRMPGLDGVQLLALARKYAPDTVRVMLTGHADIKAAIDAVNEGSIFRFLTKPCPPDVFGDTLSSALDQYRLIKAEHEILNHTLNGSVRMLTDVLSVVSPLAFRRASRLRVYVRHIVEQLRFPNVWEFELAAMLSQLGCITIPADILEKVFAGSPLTSEEATIYADHPRLAYELIAHIPRIAMIGQIVANQQKTFKELASPGLDDVVAMGAQMLKVAIDFDQLISRGESVSGAIGRLRQSPDIYNPVVVVALDGVEVDQVGGRIKQVALRQLSAGMVLQEDVKAAGGMLLLAKGQEVTTALIACLRRFADTVGVVEPITVGVPDETGPLIPMPAAAGRKESVLCH